MPTTKSQSQRKHVTNACISCRESKVKCNAALPACSNCINKGKDCKYHGNDKRKLSLRVAIELLSNRVDQLNEFIAGNGLQPPPMRTEDGAALTRLLDTLGFPRGTSTFHWPQSPESVNSQQNTSKQAMPLGQSMPSDVSDNEPTQTQPSQNLALQSPDWSWSIPDAYLLDHLPHYGHPPGMLSPVDWTRTHNPNLSNQTTAVPSRVEAPGEESGVDPKGTEEVIRQLSDRMGTLDIRPGGHVRYFGPTSNFNLVEMPAPDNLTIHRTVRNDGQDYLQCLGIDKNVPSELEEHLVKLYFTWQDPSFHVVSKAMYEQARDKWRDKMEDTPYYSEALKNAMCALGAAFENRYHPTFLTFPKSLADFFADRAKALLEIELDQPSVATVQAMVVLSGHDVGCKRDARGWLYSGMAMRLAFDLALHVDMRPYVAKGAISAAEAELRRTVFWGAYTVDHLWGLYLGRPFRINIEDVTVERPGTGPSNTEVGEWRPYVSPDSESGLPTLSDPIESISRQRVLLCEIMGSLSYVLYGRSKIPKHALQELNERTTTELFNWKNNLPQNLQVDLDDLGTPYLPHILLLHMQYYQDIIYAHRPWMSKTYIQPQPPQGAGSAHARRMCIESATAIAKLLHLYEARYTLHRINIQVVSIICSAAPILLFTAVSNCHLHDPNTTALHLHTCFRALDEFSPSWESARRSRDFLVQLQRRWESQVRAGQALKRHEPGNNHNSNSGSWSPHSPVKRSRTESGSLVESNGQQRVQADPQQQHSIGLMKQALKTC